ncbi:hypothetical protein KCP74_14120 [Salmonella enterica subsp. enterica]|nr:hypothetical protein KCP74_14120 [Salmonella enterica subsp. enterica]
MASACVSADGDMPGSVSATRTRWLRIASTTPKGRRRVSYEDYRRTLFREGIVWCRAPFREGQITSPRRSRCWPNMTSRNYTAGSEKARKTTATPAPR